MYSYLPYTPNAMVLSITTAHSRMDTQYLLNV